MNGTTTRRAFLAAVPAVAAMAAPVVAMQMAGSSAESATLLSLVNQIRATEQEYHDAVRAWDDAYRAWAPQWPLAPEVCCNKVSSWSKFGPRETERTISGRGLVREGANGPWYIKSAADMEADVESERELLAKDDRRKKSYGKAWRDYRHKLIAENEVGLALLPSYLAERDRVERESNFAAIDARRRRSAEAVFNLAREVLAEPSQGVEGVRIKALACASIGRMKAYDLTWGNMNDSVNNKTSMAALLAQAMLNVA